MPRLLGLPAWHANRGKRTDQASRDILMMMKTRSQHQTLARSM